MRKIVSLLMLAMLLFFATVKPTFAATTNDCTSKFPINKGGATGNLLYCSNKDLNTQDETVQRLVVVIHGTNRTASNYFGYMTSAAQGDNATNVLIIAPHFVIPGDVSDTDVLTWAQNDNWKSGDPAQSPAVGAYEAIDDLITGIINSKKFPNLKHVVVAGHSAGGQFTHRYAAGTQIDAKVKEAGMTMRYVVANPSSYVYFTNERPVAGTTKLDDSLSTQFAVPNGSCSTYNDYKFGFNNLNPYMTAIGPDKIKSQFKDKNVIYLLGDQDIDPNDSDLDKGCEAEAQGSFRYERGTAYYNYLQHLYGPSIKNTQFKAVVPGVAHDNNAMFNSDNGKKAIFHDDQFAPTNAGTSSSASSSITSSTSSSSSSGASNSNSSSSSSSSDSSSGNSNPIPSVVCAGSTNNVCPSPVPSNTSSSSSDSTGSSFSSGSLNGLGNLGGGNILVILLAFLLKLFSGF